MADDDLKFHVDGKSYAFDDFEIGELEWLEEHVGKSIMDTANLFSMKAITGIVYLVKRKSDPEFTLEQARKVKMGTLAEPDPEPAAKKRPPKPAAR